MRDLETDGLSAPPSGPNADVAAAAESARRAGRELVTPKALAELLGLTDTAIRTARLNGRVESPFALALTGKKLHLITVASAINYWIGESPGEIEPHLDAMRRKGTTMVLGGQFYNILSDRRVDEPGLLRPGPRFGSRFPQAGGPKDRWPQ
ncbi:MAG: hypothetical protein OXF66_06015 [Gammaproteobacteria bacterium]|nr:hypothetical protein [Gammaproteobacteria bacterium]